MFTETDIEIICLELESSTPCISTSKAVHELLAGEHGNSLSIGKAFWEENFTFLLILLAANGVEYAY